MHKYTIGLTHSSIASSPTLDYEGTLAGAKRAATKEFGDGFIDHKIVIYDNELNRAVALKRIADNRWTDAA